MKASALQNQMSEEKSSRMRALFDAFPIIQFIGAGIIGLAATWMTIQLTQNSQAAEIRHNTEKIAKLEKDAVSRELFDERTLRIIENQEKLDKRFDKLFDKK